MGKKDARWEKRGKMGENMQDGKIGKMGKNRQPGKDALEARNEGSRCGRQLPRSQWHAADNVFLRAGNVPGRAANFPDLNGMPRTKFAGARPPKIHCLFFPIS